MKIINKLMKVNFFRRIFTSILKKYVSLTNNYKVKIKYNNVLFNLDLREQIDRRLYLHGTYEENLIKTANKIIKENKFDYFLDIGACWGIYSLMIASNNKKVKIYAFDPIRSNIDRLNESVKENNFSNINSHRLAIGKQKGKIKLGVSDVHSSVYRINNKNSKKIEISPINSLDNIFKFKDKKIFIKIDVEDYEIPVLEGARKLLQNNKCLVQIEYLEEQKKVINNYFLKFGYKIISIPKTEFWDVYFSNFFNKKVYL